MSISLDSTLASDYAQKGHHYYDRVRPEMLDFIPPSARRFLDVGCGAGAFAAQLRCEVGREVWGIEPHPDSFSEAKKKLDHTFCGCFDRSLDLPKSYFDCIIFNDVLEHLYDPLSALSLARDLLVNGGVIVASIPNIGHFPTIWQLVMRGRWDYKEMGILDKTHIRFYTRSSILALFRNANFELQTIKGINRYFRMERGDGKRWLCYLPFSWLPINGIHDMRYLQFAVLAKKVD